MIIKRVVVNAINELGFLPYLLGERGIYKGKDNDYLTDMRPDFVDMTGKWPILYGHVKWRLCLSGGGCRCQVALIKCLTTLMMMIMIGTPL